jgi:putative ABC transport system permease protein
VTLRRLVLRNILGNLFRSGAIWLCAALVVSLGLSAVLVVRGAEQGLRRNLSRMGADLIVLPWGTMSQDHDGAHLIGMMTDRWMPRAYLGRIAAIQGVESVSPQLYLTTLRDSPYADGDLHLVAYDPATDFVLQPWLEHDPLVTLALGEAVVGVEVRLPAEAETLDIYGYQLRRVRTLGAMSGDIDQTVFVSFETAMALVDQVAGERHPPFTVAANTISTAMVKVRLNADPHDVAVRLLEQAPGLLPIESTGFFQSQREQMVGLMRSVLGLTLLIWLLAVVFMGLVYSLAANERRREVATLRALGATSQIVRRVLLGEGLTLALAGGVTGLLVILATVATLGPRLSAATGIELALPGAGALVGLSAGGLVLAALSVMLAAWGPTARLAQQEPALAMKE